MRAKTRSKRHGTTWPALCHCQTSMTVRRECPRCRKIGFVRAERVIKAGNGVTELMCGACEHTWIEDGTVVVHTEVATEKERER